VPGEGGLVKFASQVGVPSDLLSALFYDFLRQSGPASPKPLLQVARFCAGYRAGCKFRKSPSLLTCAGCAGCTPPSGPLPHCVRQFGAAPWRRRMQEMAGVGKSSILSTCALRTHPNLIGPRKNNFPPAIIGQIGKETAKFSVRLNRR